MNNAEYDEMSDAYVKLDPNFKFGSLVSTGIKLKAFNTTTNKPTTSGLMLDNTRMEILAVSDVKVEVFGFKELEEKYLEAVEALRMYVSLCGNTAYCVDRQGLQTAYDLAQKVITKAGYTNDH